MTDATDALKSVLAPDRTTEQRLALLHDLRAELRDEPAVLGLLEAALTEKNLELRRAFVSHAAKTDITRISDRVTFIGAFLKLACLDEEDAVRRIALKQLAGWQSTDPAIADVLLTTLTDDLDIKSQRTALNALLQSVTLTPEHAARLEVFIAHSPAELGEDLIALLDHCDPATRERGLLLFLDPNEDPALRGAALVALGKLPKLESAALAALKQIILTEPDEDFQARAIAVLSGSKEIDPSLFDLFFELLARFPERAELLDIVRDRLASFPELSARLATLFTALTSAHARVRILEILQEAPLVALFTAALSDANWKVRRAAIAACQQHHDEFAPVIEPALLSAAKSETITMLRCDIARCFDQITQRNAAVNAELLNWVEREDEPRVLSALARVLPAIPRSQDSLGIVLKTYLKLLNDPANGYELREQIVANLKNFAFADEPELVHCLHALLAQADTIEQVDSLYARLREVEPDSSAHAALHLKVFFKFASAYPRSPLDGWLKEFATLASSHPEIRAQIPLLVQLTGATWISSAADTEAQKDLLLPGLLEQIKNDNWIEAERLLREAWEHRTLRKRDMLALFKKLLRTPDQEGILQRCLVLMAKGGLTTSDVLDLAFNYLEEFPRNGIYTSLLAEFVQGVNQDSTPMRSIDEVRVDLTIARKQDPHYRQRVFEAFNQRAYSRYFRLIPESLELPPRPRDWNEWEYELWPDKGIDWCIATMFFDLKPYERIAELLAAPPDPTQTRTRSLHYLLLLYIWKNPTDDLPPATVDALLGGIAALIKNTTGKRGLALLFNRAVLVFRNVWSRSVMSFSGPRKVSPQLADAAADVYRALCEFGQTFDAPATALFPAVFPSPLLGLNSKRLEAIWPFDRALWDQLFQKHFATADADAQVRELLDSAKLAESEWRFADAHALYTQLIEKFEKSKAVQTQRTIINANRTDCDPNRPSPPGDETMAQSQHAFLLEQIQKGKFDSALKTLDRFVKRCWRTQFVRNLGDSLKTLRQDLLSKTTK